MERPARAFSLLLFVVAFLSAARNFSGGRYGAGYEILNVAKTLAETGTFGNPYGALPTGPTAHVAPLFPMFLAMLIRLLGYSGMFVLVANVCALLVQALHAALLPHVSALFFGRQWPGVWAAAISIVLPVFYFLPEFEIMYDAVGLMLFCLAAARFARVPSPWGALGLGAFLGILALLNPANLSIAGLWLVYLTWRESAGRLWRFAVWIAAGAVLVISPWTIRNYVQFHQFVPVRDNLGVELYIANNDMAAATFAENLPSFWEHHPAASVSEAREVIRMGEAAYAESRKARAIAWMRTHPGRVFELVTTRARMFWFSDSHDSRPHAWTIILVTVLSFAGLILLAVRREAIAVFLAACWLIYPLIYYCVQFDVRYRVPILWLSLLPAGYGMAAASAKLRKLWQFRM
jgi:hypothetical protein